MDKGQVLITCPNCGFNKDVPSSKLAGGKTRITCPKCACKFYLDKEGQAHVLSNVHPLTVTEQEEDVREIARRAYEREQHRLDNEAGESLGREDKPQEVPWASAPGQDGWVSAFTRTMLDVMLQAPKFASRLRKDSSLLRPLSFYLIICVFYILVEYFWTDALISFLTSSSTDDPNLKELLTLIAPNKSFFTTILLQAAMYVIQLYLISFLMYFIYALLAGEKINFALIFQILSYGAAPLVLSVIPAVGALAGMIWSIGIVAVCCKVVTGLDWPRTFAGFLPPLLLLFLVIGQVLKVVA